MSSPAPGREVIVQVKDENNKPVGGAAVAVITASVRNGCGPNR